MPPDPDDLDRHFRSAVTELTPTEPTAAPIPEALLGDLYTAQLESRHLDFAARRLRAEGLGYYTIGSAGHEGNAAVAAAVRATDPALLHYRSGAFYLARARQAAHPDGLDDVLLGLLGAADEPIAGGRHKVFGHAALNVIPQTSTIGSHLPRAVGVGFAIERARKLAVASPWPSDAVAVCSFGDASANHSTVTGALNTACHVTHQGLPLPVLFVCEDNGLGISVPTPPDWIRAAYGHRPGLHYVYADGCDVTEAYTVAQQVSDWVRTRRRPAFLHLRTVRYLGHAGSDAEIAYRSAGRISADYALDPLLGTARALLSRGLRSRSQLLAEYDDAAMRVSAAAARLQKSPQLPDAAAITAPLAPRSPDRVAAQVSRRAASAERQAAFAGRLPEDEGGLTVAGAINATLADALAARPNLLVFGEDVGRKGGVYGLTRGLARRFGAGRVFDTVLDEQSILGLALGTGISGFLPVPEIQYLAYLHNAEDQIRGEAASLQFFSQGQYRNPMVVRIPSYAYQKGFGGHFHNDNSVAVLRDIPGLVIASPSRPDDAAAMLRTCLAAAEIDGAVCLFLEPIALYHTRDLYEDGDNAWLAPYPPPQDWAASHVPLGRGRVHGSGSDLTLVTFGNGLAMSLRAAGRLATERIAVRVLDLRWLAPLPVEDLLVQARATGRVLVVDETRHTGGVGEGVLTALVEGGFTGAMARVSGRDSFVPLGDAATKVLVDESAIEQAARRLVQAP